MVSQDHQVYQGVPKAEPVPLDLPALKVYKVFPVHQEKTDSPATSGPVVCRVPPEVPASLVSQGARAHRAPRAVRVTTACQAFRVSKVVRASRVLLDPKANLDPRASLASPTLASRAWTEATGSMASQETRESRGRRESGALPVTPGTAFPVDQAPWAPRVTRASTGSLVYLAHLELPVPKAKRVAVACHAYPEPKAKRVSADGMDHLVLPERGVWRDPREAPENAETTDYLDLPGRLALRASLEGQGGMESVERRVNRRSSIRPSFRQASDRKVTRVCPGLRVHPVSTDGMDLQDRQDLMDFVDIRARRASLAPPEPLDSLDRRVGPVPSERRETPATGERENRARGAPRDSVATLAARATKERVARQVRAISKALCKGLQDPLESREYQASKA